MRAAMEAACFPSADENAAASGLLLLRHRPPASSQPSPTPTRPSSAAATIFAALSLCEEEIASSCVTDSSSSAAACNHGVQNQVDPLRLLATIACLDRIRPKIMKKARSKLLQEKRLSLGSTKEFTSWCGSAGGGKKKEGIEEDLSPGSEETAVSSLTSASSLSTARPGVGLRSGIEERKRARTDRTLGSTPMWRRAEAIVAMLATGSFTETKIREALGDSPDTSKALRMLLKLKEVKRFGSGGRTDPFLYMVANERGEVSST